jgi:hypothetical protein
MLAGAYDQFAPLGLPAVQDPRDESIAIEQQFVEQPL